MFAPKLEKYIDTVTDEKVAQSNQKGKGCQVRLYFTFCSYLHSLKYDLQAHIQAIPPSKNQREREREREREGKRKRERGKKEIRQEGTAVDPVEKTLMSSFFFFFFFYILHVVIRIISSSN